MSELISWAAGLFEGEGYVGTRTDGRTKYGPYARATMTSTDLDVLEKFLCVVGMGKIRGPYNTKTGRKPQYRWDVNTWNEVTRFYGLIGPWLCSRRIRQFEGTLSQKPPERKKRYYKLSEAIEDEIKARYSTGGISQSALAREYGVDSSFICRLVKT